MGSVNKSIRTQLVDPTPPLPSVRLIADLNDLERGKLELRLKFVTRIATDFNGICSKDAYLAISAGLEGELPSYSSVQKWNRKWCESNHDPNALVPKTRCRETRSKQLDQRALAFLNVCITDFFLTRVQPTTQALFTVVTGTIHEANDALPVWDKIRYPSRSSVYRAVQEIDPYILTLKRFGKRAADMQFKDVKDGANASYPLEKVQMDHTTLDVLLVYGDTLRRPYLTVAIDVFSRMVVGYCLSFDAPGYNSVMQCLMHAILPKTETPSETPRIENFWPCSGIPGTLILDNAAEFHGKALNSAAMQLSMEIQYCPRKEPQYKGIVERFFGTLNTRLLHMIPGTTRSNIQKKDDYASHEAAGISAQDLERRILQFIVDDYSQTFHSGLGDKPVSAWVKGTKEHAVRPYTGSLPLVALLGAVEKRVVRRDGITFMNLRYASANLSDALRRWHIGKPINATLSAKFKYDPKDLSSIWVFIFEGEDPINVPCIHTQYAAGLTVMQHKQCRKIITVKHGNKGEFPDPKLARVRRDIILGAQEDANTGRKARNKRSKRKSDTSDTPRTGNDPQLPSIFTPIDELQNPFNTSDIEAAADQAKKWFSTGKLTEGE